jgi:hypothetical protein
MRAEDAGHLAAKRCEASVVCPTKEKVKGVFAPVPPFNLRPFSRTVLRLGLSGYSVEDVLNSEARQRWRNCVSAVCRSCDQARMFTPSNSPEDSDDRRLLRYHINDTRI